MNGGAYKARARCGRATRAPNVARGPNVRMSPGVFNHFSIRLPKAARHDAKVSISTFACLNGVRQLITPL